MRKICSYHRTPSLTDGEERYVHSAPTPRRSTPRELPVAAFIVAVLLVSIAGTTSAAGALGVSQETAIELIENTTDHIVVRFEPDRAGLAESTFLQVPDRGRIEAFVEPAGAALVSKPGLMRGLRIVQVAFGPAADMTGATVTLRATAEPGVNEVTRRRLPVSPVFEDVYRSTILNYREADRAANALVPGTVHGDMGRRGEIEYGARFLVITTPSYASIVDDLAEWRHRMGLQTMVVDLDTTGYTTSSIKSYIQTAYDSWAVPPEYILLVGDTEQLPIYEEDTTATDGYYAQLEGNDLFIDALIGRFTADSPGECATLVAKALGYERTPVTNDPAWPSSGTLMVADDFDEGDWIYYMNTWFIYDLMENAGFTEIDTLFHRNNVSQSEVYAAFNAGRGFVNFRGQAWTTWPGAFGVNPDYLTNGWKLPIVVSATCATGIYHSDGFICEDIVRAGSSTYPRGAVAFLGTNTAYPGSGRLARLRGAGDMAFFEQAFGENGGQLGAAALAAKLAVYEFDGDATEYKGWNLLGDPAMCVWTDQPMPLQVIHDEYFHESESAFDVTVLSNGQALEGALVACVKDSDIYAWGTTDAAGHVSFPLSPSSSGPFSITVTARNHVPYEGSATALDSGSFLVYSDMVLDDTAGGNGDGLLSPGETADVTIALENTGDVGASMVTATLRALASEVTLVDSVSSYGSVLPSEIAQGSPAYTIEALASCPVGRQIPLELSITNGDTTRTIAPPVISIATGDLEIINTIIDDAAPGGDGGGDASAGEVVGLTVTFENIGLCGVDGVTAMLTSVDPYVTGSSNTAFLGDVDVDGVVSNAITPFVVSIAPDAPDGHELALNVVLSGTGTSYTYSETLTLDLAVTGPTMSLATGPDTYGYYCYDVSDSIYAPAPAYEWYDIASPGPGDLIEEITDADAATVEVHMPFGFVYYGTSYLIASVCSNGFVSMGIEDYRFGNNCSIPNTDGPENMIAPFWDDLDPSASGDIYRWYDSENHRFIIQFDEIPIWNTSEVQTFQVILLDQDYYPTPSGDGQILIVYKTVNAPMGCTVGIENFDETDGIQYLYDGTYDGHAAPLVSGSALLFTTVAPVEPDVPWLVLDNLAIDDTVGGDGSGTAGSGETVELMIDLGNQGDASATDVTATLVSGSAAATVVDSTTTYSDILVGGTGDNDVPFVVRIAESLSDTVATLWLKLESNSGGYQGVVRCELHIDLDDTGVSDIPLAFGLRPCYPNPFHGGTSLQLSLPAPADASVRIYSPGGRLVRTLHDGRLEAGSHTLDWDGSDSTGRRVASGVYFVRAQAGSREESRKVVLLR